MAPPADASSGAATAGSDGAPDVFTDEFRNAAEGMRSTSKWIASAFGAIPAVVGAATLIKGPGTAGWSADELRWGAILTVLGAVIGIYGFAWVQFPGDLNDNSVEEGDMSSVPEAHGFKTYTELRDELEGARTRVANQRMASAEARGLADGNKAVAADAEATLAALVDSVTEFTPKEQGDAGDKFNEQLADARAKVIEAHAAAAESENDAAIAAASIESDPLAALEGLRRAAYGAALARTIQSRFKWALFLGVVAVVLVASGVVKLAQAPKDKEAASATATKLVLVTPNRAGLKRLGCQAAQGKTRPIPAILLGGTDSAPKIFTLGSHSCPTQTILIFPTEKQPLGTMSP